MGTLWEDVALFVRDVVINAICTRSLELRDMWESDDVSAKAMEYEALINVDGRLFKVTVEEV